MLDYRQFHDAWRRQFTAPSLRDAPIRHRARRCLFFSAKLTRLTLLCRNWKSIEVLHRPYFLLAHEKTEIAIKATPTGTRLSNEDKDRLLEYFENALARQNALGFGYAPISGAGE
jgi:hypothetical protein